VASKQTSGFSAEERAAMKERAKELREEAKRGAKADEVNAVLEKIAELPEADRVLAEQLHALVTRVAPELSPKLWYGMPAYAKDGKVVCFFQGAEKFKTRYSTFGFSDSAKLDEGDFWPTSYALTKLTATVEKTIAALIKQASA
jgi:uncharacterized protein YdhG (YjbR/CyaY superfamily)